jgi:hypothetical protein
VSKILMRALLGPSPSEPAGERASERYEKGLLSSYLAHARGTLAAAEPLAGRTRPADRAVVWRQLARSAESLCKAVRLSHDLPASRLHDVQRLVYGDPVTRLRGLPADSAWKLDLAPLVALDFPDRIAAEEPSYWIRMLRQLLTRARSLPRPAPRPSARGPRPRARW